MSAHEMDTYSEPQEQQGTSSSSARRRLVRPREGRQLAGVAAGIGDHLGIDPIIVRIVLAASAIAGGLGVLAYGLAWLAIPDEATTSPREDEPPGLRRWPLYVLGALVALAMLDVVAIGSWDGDGVVARLALMAVAAVAVLVASVLRPSRLAIAAGVAAGVVGLVVASLVVIDVPLRGGIGDRQWAPTSVVHDRYRLAVGDAVLDLTATGDAAIDSVVTVGIGNLTIIVPGDAMLDLDVSAGAGKVDVLGRSDDGIDAHRRVLAAGHVVPRQTIHLEARVGIGNVDVVTA